VTGPFISVRTLRALIFHGYLLRGTGSNIYNANLAQALVRLGWDVHLLCQEREARELDWVHAIGRWSDGELEIEQLREPDGEGQLTVYTPEIAGLLPVYVHDQYPGFEVKTFGELSDAELERYLAANVAAVEDVAARAGDLDASLANHLVMGPLILSRAGLRCAAKIHGSALEYTVKPNPRFLPHAEEGMAAASTVLVGSRHTAQSLWATLPDLDLQAKTRLGPPGVDTDAFAPRAEGEAVAAVEGLAEQIATGSGEKGLGRDSKAAAAALRDFAAEGPRVIFGGKLIHSKGVDLLLAAWPLVHVASPGARLLVVGFGAYEDGLRQLLAALEGGHQQEALEVARLGRALEGGPEGALGILEAFLSDPPPGYLDAAHGAAGSVQLAGRLEHAEVAEALPAADALVMPSTFPESFGMVPVEAAACGALPISAAHSGMLEVSRQLAKALPADIAALISFPIEEGAVGELADRLRAWLALDRDRRREIGALLARRVDELWSWEGVARGVISASQGRLDELSPP
jgi:glycosyltransferase involved in cell wall biosynthesis